MAIVVVLALVLAGGFTALSVWAGSQVHVGLLDARDLAEKTFTWRPTLALDWPEMWIIRVWQPDDDGLVLLKTRCHRTRHNSASWF